MHTNIIEQVVFDNTKVVKATFTANATTDIFTSSAHGLVNGDCVQVSNSGGALPAGLSASTNYYIISATTNTFQLSTNPGGSAINITDAGSGTNSINIKGRAIYVGDAKDIAISIGFSSTPTMTVKCQGAITKEDAAPDFNAASSVTNRWDYIDMYAIASGETDITGATGVACTGSAAFAIYRTEAKLTWLCFTVSAFTQGNLDIRVSIYRQ